MRKSDQIQRSFMWQIMCCTALVLISCTPSSSQNLISLPQYSPLAINPAMSGETGLYKLNFDSKSQWKSIGSPFKTNQVSFDMSLKRNQAKTGGHFGLGFYALSDAGGVSNFAQKQFILSAAYHLKLNLNSALSLGFNTGFMQHHLTNADGRWGSQYTGFEYDPSISSGEQIPLDKYADWILGTGIHYSWAQAKPARGFSTVRKLNIGLSANPITSSELGSSVGLRTQIYPSYTAYINGCWPIAEMLALEPAYYYRKQSANDTYLFGCNVRVILNDGQSFASKAKEFSIAGGVFMRMGESLIANGSMRWSDYSLSLAYDIATGDIKKYANSKGGLELGFGWWIDQRKPK